MTNHKIQFVGSPCGHHGNYTFYKAFKYTLHGKQRILSLGEFFFVKIWQEEDIISVAEAQLLWEDRASGQILVSLRIYFLPENTPDGRCEEHGEHEVVSLSEKVVLRAEDVIGWMRAAGGVKWDKGLKGVYGPPSQDPNSPSDAFYTPPISGALDIKEIMREKKLIGDVIEPNSLHIIILGYDKYCRMRALLKRLEGVEEEYMKSRIVVALGGFVVPSRRTWMLFCREVFDYPELEGHDLLCNHLLPEVLTDQVVPPAAPKLQGRPRKKRKKQQGDSESESSETSEDIRPRLKGKPGLTAKPNGLRVLDRKNTTRSHLTNVKTEFQTPALNRLIEVDFMSKLHKFMKDRGTPITRVPHIGYRQLNVFELFTKVQQLGGFEAVGEKKMWRSLYDEMSGISPSSNSQQAGQSNAAIMKRHYERLLLPYEKFLLQEQKKLFIGSQRPNKVKSEPGEPSVSILQVPKVTTKKDSGTIPEDLAKRPEITITPIPRSIGSVVPGGPLHDPLAAVPPGLKGLQLADLMTLENIKASFGMSALQDLAKIAERYEKPLQEPATKKLKTEDGARVNGANSREKGNGRPSVIQETPASKAGLPAVPGLVSADMIRQMNLLDAKLLLPAHQSNKTISAIAQLLPQTSIFPAPAPAAHQPHISKSIRDPNPIRPDPPRVIQSQSVYSQAKHIYGKPTTDVNKMSVKDTNKSASPEIEILDLSRPTVNKSSKPPKTERPEIELLDLSTRRDITVSPVSKPGTSKNCNSNRIQPPSVSIKSSDHPARQSPNKPQGGANPVTAALAAAQGLPPGLGGLPLNPAALLPYLSPMLSPGVKPNSGAGGSPHISIFPFMDLAAYYNSMLPQGLIPTTSSSGSGGSSASTTAAQHMAAAQLHLSSLGLSSGLSGLTPDALASLGIYKNFLPQGNLPAPHFLSGLMSPHNHNPPTSK
ncbi:uncharacterized protein LOC135196373 isoform X5 [Macrobrachium nipponense]|uniref:uncharacterized protein LOC135196373 isoform X5 n=1 Tax=Macrobrachium nipponense TaxID=159736 RepID=UPI0030C7EE36